MVLLYTSLCYESVGDGIHVQDFEALPRGQKLPGLLCIVVILCTYYTYIVYTLYMYYTPFRFPLLL